MTYPLYKHFKDRTVIIGWTKGEGGLDKVYNGSADRVAYGRLREHNEVFSGQEAEVSTTDAEVYYPPETNVIAGDIIKHESTFYRAERVVKAKRLGSTNIIFVKVFLEKDVGIPGVS